MTAFLRWLFGLNGFNEWQVGTNHSLNNEQSQVFSMIFTQQPCASGVWG